jgi:hypothetical protein
MCKSAVWIAPETIQVAKALDAEPVCSDCMDPTGDLGVYMGLLGSRR